MNKVLKGKNKTLDRCWINVEECENSFCLCMKGTQIPGVAVPANLIYFSVIYSQSILYF